ncbi:MAG: AI-2E family transporter [Anaerolineae bacterium]|nr:AI-2E family transporter [Anaerolineae bacterium]
MEETIPEELLDSAQETDAESPPWNRTTRRIVALILAALVLFLMWRFQGLIGQLVIAALVAYLLNPIIDFIDRRTPLTRGWAMTTVYLLFVLLVLGMLTMTGVAVYGQVSDLIRSLPNLIAQAFEFAGELTNNPNAVLVFGPYSFSLADVDWADLGIQSKGLLDPALRGGPAVVGKVAQGTLNVIGWFTLTLFMSIYIALDLPRLGVDVETTMVQSGYYADYQRLRQGLVRIGNAYLRGQVILGLVVGVVTGMLLGLLGVHNALALGVLAGVLEFIPYFGPIFSAVVAILVAFFQPENYLGLTQFQFALATLAVMILVQQVENNFLVPRIVGDALNLKPLTVIIAAIIGGALAGILGIILAAPVTAVIRLFGGYLWRKLLVLPPFPPENTQTSQEPSLLGRTIGSIRRRIAPPDEEPVDKSSSTNR